jgi:UDP-glucose 4-epimerase
MSGAVLVTGGAGYVGSHAVLALIDGGYRPVVLDNLSTGSAAAVPEGAPLIVGDVADGALVERIFAEHDIAAVMHFAASLVVAESVADPLAYYRNNTIGTFRLLERCVARGVGRFIFSSSAAVYGPSQAGVVSEREPCLPISPYGASKLFCERMLMDAASAHASFRPICLRYFNVAGADDQGRAGQRGAAPTDLISVAIETAIGARPRLQIFGRDYATRDGTCERDYVHVSDVAQAHVAALRYLEDDGAPTVLNCGYGTGHTVLEVISALEGLVGCALPTQSAARRPGDPPRLIADASEIRRRLSWRPSRDALPVMIQSALRMRRSQGDDRVVQAAGV